MVDGADHCGGNQALIANVIVSFCLLSSFQTNTSNGKEFSYGKIASPQVAIFRYILCYEGLS